LKVIGVVAVCCLLLAGCGAKTVEPPLDGDLETSRIIDFRTGDFEPMKGEARLILDYVDFKDYLSDYAVLENPSFIEKADLEVLEGINESYFRTGAIGVAVSVESSGSNMVTGKKVRRQGDVLFLVVQRKVAAIGTTDIATRHSLFLLNAADVSGIKAVDVERIVEK